MSDVKPILIAACGNPDAGDDAFGPLVAAELQKQPVAGVEVIDLGTSPATLLYHLEGRRVLIVVDAAVGTGLAAGELLECNWHSPQRPALRSQKNLSSHALSLPDQIALAGQLGLLPPVVRIVALESSNDRSNFIPEKTIKSAVEIIKELSRQAYE